MTARAIAARIFPILGVLVAIASICVLSFALVLYLFHIALGSSACATHEKLCDGFLGGLVGAGATALLAYIAWTQLKGIATTASADFIIKLKRDFFTREERRLMHLIDNDWLKFRRGPDDQPWFEVDQEAVGQSSLPPNIKRTLLLWPAYSAFDVDDILLQHFEDAGMLTGRHLLNVDMVFDQFSWYVEKAWQNCAIQKYIQSERKRDPRLYEKFEELYNKFQRRER